MEDIPTLSSIQISLNLVKTIYLSEYYNQRKVVSLGKLIKRFKISFSTATSILMDVLSIISIILIRFIARL